MTLFIQLLLEENIMSKTAVIQARIDPEIKEKSQKILKALNISMSEAISLYLTQITLNRGIPFDIKLPNNTTFDTFHKAETGKEVHAVNSVDSLFKELEN